MSDSYEKIIAELRDPVDRALAPSVAESYLRRVADRLAALRASGQKADDSAWMFDPARLPARDEDGWTFHPDLPEWGEGEDGVPVLSNLGYDSVFVNMEDDAPDAVCEAYFRGDSASCVLWVPTPPSGYGWLLAGIWDSENYPLACFVRYRGKAAPPSTAPAASGAAPDDVVRWKASHERLMDALVVNHIYQKEHETNAQKAITDLLSWECLIALDPRVCSTADEAKKWREHIAAAPIATPDDSTTPCAICGVVVGGSYCVEPKRVMHSYCVGTAPCGWKLVPVKATPEMIEAGFGPFLAAHDPIFIRNEPCEPIYKAMLAAAPASVDQQGWLGCGECDSAFPCYEGKARCMRLPPPTGEG